jgi:hypothetical protein
VDTGPIAFWIVPLVGHQFDLEDLPLWLAGQDVHVDIRDNTFVLVIPSAIVGDSYRSVRAFAESQLELINGIRRLLNSAFRPLSLADRLFGMDSAGAVLHTLAVNPAEERDKATLCGRWSEAKFSPTLGRLPLCHSYGPPHVLLVLAMHSVSLVGQP